MAIRYSIKKGKLNYSFFLFPTKSTFISLEQNLGYAKGKEYTEIGNVMDHEIMIATWNVRILNRVGAKQ
uniref:Uncharacterized protein n=1 Tax=Megaselia scalaris TaxID=36166 RepID=T1GMY3_MEGSC